MALSYPSWCFLVVFVLDPCLVAPVSGFGVALLFYVCGLDVLSRCWFGVACIRG